jgi:hypothetical protein
MFNYEGELWEDDSDPFLEPDLFWRFRIMDTEHPDRAMAVVLVKWTQEVGAEDVKVGTRVAGVYSGSL